MPVKHEITIPSSYERAKTVQQQILLQLEVHQFPPADVFGIRLALEEALVNAIRHGNKDNPAKTIRIAYAIDADLATFEIEDQGEGFNPNSVPDPTQPENIPGASGRGLYLIRTFMDSVRFNERGNQIIFSKKRCAHHTSADPRKT